MFQQKATDGLAPVAVDGEPATKRKAITGGRIAGIAVFLLGVVATGVVAVTGHHLSLTNAIIAGLGTLTSAVGTGFATHRGVFAAVNTTSAERSLLAELVPLVKVGLPAIFAAIKGPEPVVPAAPVEVPVAPAPPVVDTAQVTAAVVAALGPLGPQLADTVQSAIVGVVAGPVTPPVTADLSAPVGAVPLGSAS